MGFKGWFLCEVLLAFGAGLFVKRGKASLEQYSVAIRGITAGARLCLVIGVVPL